jgi:(2Fe-2S) ferredoxin
MSIKDLTLIKTHLFFCNGESCKKRGAAESTAAVRASIEAIGLTETVHTTKTLCNGRCKDGPVVIAMPKGYWFKKITADKAGQFVDEFLVKGRVPSADVLYLYGSDDLYPAK